MSSPEKTGAAALCNALGNSFEGLSGLRTWALTSPVLASIFPRGCVLSLICLRPGYSAWSVHTQQQLPHELGRNAQPQTHPHTY